MKREFLTAIAKGNIIVMDESHNASGKSQTGTYLRTVLESTKGVVFLSATFAKRPDNMMIYMDKTSMSDANMAPEEITEAVERGGVALQEIIATQLVEEGQLIRRERSFEGVVVNWIYLDDTALKYGLENKEVEHRAISDAITGVMRDIIGFQGTHVSPVIDLLDEDAKEAGKELAEREGTGRLGVDNKPYFSKVFNIVNQMLFSIKADQVAHLAIRHLREGRKPVIAFANTMESFLKDDVETLEGIPAGIGDKIKADFVSTLKRGLEGTLRVTEFTPDGDTDNYALDLQKDISREGQMEYDRILDRIRSASSGVTISPIDYITQKIEAAGYSVGEVTGRQRRVELDINFAHPNGMNGLGNITVPHKVKASDGMEVLTGTMVSRKKQAANDLFRKFNDNEIDVLLINQSGSTGASAHAIPTPKVPADEVKPRVMIILQPELDINTEVQKRGRIHRTGQIFTPRYDYVVSAIPAEKRLMMMLQRKLKSLDANTSGNQRNSEALLAGDDFLNKYGNEVVARLLSENPELNDELDDPLDKSGINLEQDGEDVLTQDIADRKAKEQAKKEEGNPFGKTREDFAHFVSGRVAVLSTEGQENFYNSVIERYKAKIEFLKEQGKYDLEVEVMDLQARNLEKHLVIVGVNPESVFGDSTVMELCEINNLKKPFTQDELRANISAALDGGDAKEIHQAQIAEWEEYYQTNYEAELQAAQNYAAKNMKAFRESKGFLKLKDPEKIVAKLAEKEELFNAVREMKIKDAKAHWEDLNRLFKKVLKFFHIGRALSIPPDSEGEKSDKGVFLGFKIEGWTPSRVNLKFAIASSRKYLNVPLSSWRKFTLAVIGESNDLSEWRDRDYIDNWDKYTREASADRVTRYIVTGNILQGIETFRGLLISFTTQDGSTRKGILMPQSYKPTQKDLEKVEVPIIEAYEVIRDMGDHRKIQTELGMIIEKEWRSNRYQIAVPGSKSKGGKWWEDEEITRFIIGRNWIKKSGLMTGEINPDDLKRFLRILQRKIRDRVTLSPFQFGQIKEKIMDRITRKKTERDKRNESIQADNTQKLRLAEAEAAALILKLKLLQIAA